MVHSDPQQTDFIDLPVPKNNVDKIWIKNELKSEKGGAKGNGIAGNGTIAACTFHGSQDNLIVYDYDGNRLWTSGGMLNAFAVTSTPMVGWDKKEIHSIIACDNKVILNLKLKEDDKWIEWISDIPNPVSEVLIPLSPNIMDKGNVVILPTKNGPLYAFDVKTGDLLSMKFPGAFKNNDISKYYSTVNSACVNNSGTRVYIAAESSKTTDQPRSRLYAFDLNKDSNNDNDFFTEAWFYPYQGKSAASPLFIDNTIYFDAYKQSGLGLINEQKIYALTENKAGYIIDKVSYPRKTWFSFSKDPREGFWYEDTRGKQLVRYNKEEESIVFVENIFIRDLLEGKILKGLYKPCSCMTICDNKDPVMLISAISLWPTQYLLAVDLKNNNKVLWLLKIDEFGWNYAGGQFTILRKDDDPSNNRILFGTYWDGVMAIGSAD